MKTTMVFWLENVAQSRASWKWQSGRHSNCLSADWGEYQRDSMKKAGPESLVGKSWHASGKGSTLLRGKTWGL